MKRKVFVAAAMVLVGGAILVATLRESSAFAPQQQEQRLKIGVVKLQACIDKYKRKADLEKELEKAREDAKREILDLKTRYEGLREIIRNVAGAMKDEKMREYKRLEMDMQFAEKWNRIKYTDLYEQAMTSLYNDIRAAVDDVGKGEKFDMIMKFEEPWLDPDSPESITDSIARRPVLYVANDIDITEKVVARVNARYDEKKKDEKSK